MTRGKALSTSKIRLIERLASDGGLSYAQIVRMSGAGRSSVKKYGGRIRRGEAPFVTPVQLAAPRVESHPQSVRRRRAVEPYPYPADRADREEPEPDPYLPPSAPVAPQPVVEKKTEPNSVLKMMHDQLDFMQTLQQLEQVGAGNMAAPEKPLTEPNSCSCPAPSSTEPPPELKMRTLINGTLAMMTDNEWVEYHNEAVRMKTHKLKEEKEAAAKKEKEAAAKKEKAAAQNPETPPDEVMWTRVLDDGTKRSMNNKQWREYQGKRESLVHRTQQNEFYSELRETEREYQDKLEEQKAKLRRLDRAIKQEAAMAEASDRQFRAQEIEQQEPPPRPPSVKPPANQAEGGGPDQASPFLIGPNPTRNGVFGFRGFLRGLKDDLVDKRRLLR